MNTKVDEVVHVFTFDTEWDWCLPEQKLVSFQNRPLQYRLLLLFVKGSDVQVFIRGTKNLIFNDDWLDI